MTSVSRRRNFILFCSGCKTSFIPAHDDEQLWAGDLLDNKQMPWFCKKCTTDLSLSTLQFSHLCKRMVIVENEVKIVTDRLEQLKTTLDGSTEYADLVHQFKSACTDFVTTIAANPVGNIQSTKSDRTSTSTFLDSYPVTSANDDKAVALTGAKKKTSEITISNSRVVSGPKIPCTDVKVAHRLVNVKPQTQVSIIDAFGRIPCVPLPVFAEKKNLLAAAAADSKKSMPSDLKNLIGSGRFGSTSEMAPISLAKKIQEAPDIVMNPPKLVSSGAANMPDLSAPVASKNTSKTTDNKIKDNVDLVGDKEAPRVDQAQIATGPSDIVQPPTAGNVKNEAPRLDPAEIADRRSRAKNVICHGIPETGHSSRDSWSAIQMIYNESSITLRACDFTTIERIGLPLPAKIRPIRVCLTDEDVRKAIIMNFRMQRNYGEMYYATRKPHVLTEDRTVLQRQESIERRQKKLDLKRQAADM